MSEPNRNPATSIEVAEVGSYYVGGRTITLAGLPPRENAFLAGDQNGELAVEAMYVQYVRLVRPRGRFPLLLWHGGGLTGTTFETKPDGGPGWQQFFLRHGWDVYLSDAVERGRAGWTRFPEVWDGEPYFRTKKDAWERFRIGTEGSYDPDPAKRKAIPGVQFPLEAFDEFANYEVPRWDVNDDAIQRAYEAYVRRQGPCIILGHSQGCSFAYRAAQNAPDLVKAVIIDEGRPMPGYEHPDFAALKSIPHLFVYGDNIDGDPRWEAMREPARKYAHDLAGAGGMVDFYELPKMGITGNSHMNMMDRNSDEVAAVIQSWLESKGLVR